MSEDDIGGSPQRKHPPKGRSGRSAGKRDDQEGEDVEPDSTTDPAEVEPDSTTDPAEDAGDDEVEEVEKVEVAAQEAAGADDDVYVWHDPAPPSSNRTVVVALVSLLVGALLGALAWAAFDPGEEEATDTATTVGATDVAVTSELIVQCVYGDYAGCSSMIAATMADRCFGGATALEIPGRPEGSEAEILLTVEQLTDLDPIDAAPTRVGASETELVSCADVDASAASTTTTSAEAPIDSTTTAPPEG